MPSASSRCSLCHQGSTSSSPSLAGQILRSLIFREPPIVAKATLYDLTFRWDFLVAAGSLILYAAVIAWLLMVLRGRLRPIDLFVVYGRTLRQLALPIVTFAFILAIAQIMNYAGMTSSLAIALSRTGVLFPFVSAFLGALGVFLTGSDTSSNSLFGPLQAQTAKLQGISPVLTAATNSSGGVMGKMISPQNLSVGAAGVNQVGAEGDIFRRTIGYSLILTSLMGLLAMFQAYVVPAIIPVTTLAADGWGLRSAAQPAVCAQPRYQCPHGLEHSLPQGRRRGTGPS